MLVDQRGSGRSRPLANAPDADLNSNTAAHLIADIVALREMHGVDRWTILGLSWGTTLGLAYAQAYSHRVNTLVLGFVTATSRREVQWITEAIYSRLNCIAATSRECRKWGTSCHRGLPSE